MRWLLTVIVGLVVAVAAAVAVVSIVRFHGGPLNDEFGNGVGGPWKSNAPLAFGLLELDNHSGREVEVERVRLGPHSRGLQYLGTLFSVPGCHNPATMTTFPPKGPCRYETPDSVSVPAHGRVEGFVGVRAPTGKYVLHGVYVDYKRPVIGPVALHLRVHAGLDWTLCTVPQWPHRLCDPPSTG